MKTKWELVWHPVPEPEKFDTGLRYTDILFGFVIRELFLRLQNWVNLPPAVRLHLLVGLTLVLGSWIGFRRSLNRPVYQLKFFNLPFFRFLLDQVMLIVYFRVAVLTTVPDAGTVWPSASKLAQETNELVLYVFVLYAFWDLFGIWMNTTKGKDGKPRYPKVDPKTWTKLETSQDPDGWGIIITTVCLLITGVLWKFAYSFNPDCLFLSIAVLLLIYRWSKEVRTSWKSSQT